MYGSRTTAVRRGGVVACACAIATGMTSPASAADVSLRSVEEDVSGKAVEFETVGYLAVTGGAGPDVLSIRLEAGALVVDSAAGVRAGEGCEPAGAASARCALRGTRVRLVLDAGAGDDDARLPGGVFERAAARGGPGNDRLAETGGSPAATTRARLSPTTVFDGGAGADQLTGSGNAHLTYRDRVAPVTVDLTSPGAAAGEAGEGDRISGVDTVWGGSGDDTMTAATGSTLFGRAGDDTLLAGGGMSSLYGGDGADRLRGGRAGDWLVGGGGSDRVDGGAGDDEMFAVRPVRSARSMTRSRSDRDRLDGGNGDDLLAPGPGRDTLTGGPGEDRVGFGSTSRAERVHAVGRGDRVDARDRSRDIVACDRRHTAVIADRLDLTQRCLPRLRRHGTPRPGVIGGLDFAFDFQRSGWTSTYVGCQEDMPRSCSFRAALYDGGRAVARERRTVRRGRLGAVSLRAPRALRRRIACGGPMTLRILVRTRDAAGRPVAQQRTATRTFSPGPSC